MNLKFEGIYLNIYSNNDKRYIVIKKLGFVPYKIEDNVVIINGESVNIICMKLHK